MSKRPTTHEEYVARFWSRVEKTDTCWLWNAALSSTGYGVFRVGGSPGRLLYAHRFAYELVKGDIPEGLFLDHLCRVTNCVNPGHLEAVTPQINVDRGLGRKREKCAKGHIFEGDNIYLRPDTGARQCLTCKHEYWKIWYARRKENVD